MDKITTHSPQETKDLAEDILTSLSTNLVALVGPLGSGKTVFAQGVGQLLNIDSMLSPTYTLIRQYSIDHSRFKTLYHIDLYRLNSTQQILDLGIQEIWQDKSNLVLIEWADKIEGQLPKNHLRLNFAVKDQNTRLISIEK